MHALVWNIRSVNTERAFERLITMHRKYHFEFIGLMEPKQQSRKLERYRRQIDFEQAIVNTSNKIWAFIDGKYDVTVVIDAVQQLTLRLYDIEEEKEFMGGDFNVIWDEEEKFGGLPASLNEVDDFRHCMNTCNLTDMGFKGCIYTWWNGRAKEDCIFKRLDRVFTNMEMQQIWPGLDITHLPKIGSDHYPLLITYSTNAVQIKKSFRFLSFWTKHDTFKAVVKENWQADFQANLFAMFNYKLKKLKKALSGFMRLNLN
ncbi:PREDICTED: uncharacterized protein LOC109224143 [Nicotiana attenuata]|uniref:uncharacterized protein LOC109224143 n=1 Tax=Nicotiana attenuata TaxID=49451 RepID=UPI000905C72C|nr:PREDICTED: uncharacterized protein LOC109224143 [Nicotiana attenuata]